MYAALALALFVVWGQEAPGLAQTRLSLDLTLDFDAGTVAGTAAPTVRNVGSRPESTVPLQLGRLMTATMVRDGSGRPLTFEQDVIRLEDWPEFQLDQLHVRLAHPLAPGEEATVELDYSGVLVPYTETGMLYVRDHVDRDFAVSARITVPEGLTVATGFDAQRVEISGSARTWVFESPEPIPFLNMTVAPYEELSGDRVRILYFADDAAGARRLEEAVSRATNLYPRWFGPGPTEGRLTIMEIPEGWGSQAHRVAGIIQTADAFRDGEQMTRLYHELAHLWHPPDLEKPAPRWNEGLATFLQYRVVDAVDEPGSLGLTGRAYTTGAVFFRILYRLMGEDSFDAALADWMSTYRLVGTTSSDLVGAFVRHGGNRVQRVVDDWMYGTRWYEELSNAGGVAQLIVRYGGSR